MKQLKTKRLSLASLFCALAVVGSFISFPVFASKCAPIQHMINILCALLLGPAYSVGVAFVASLIRNLMGLGSLLAFPGSMFGALICSLAYKYTKKLWPTLIGEVLGTAILGGLCAYPMAIYLMGVPYSSITFYAYMLPFFISTFVGAILSGMIIFSLNKTHVLSKIQATFER